VAETQQAGSPVPRSLVLAAFATVYVVWGSTYLAIRYAVETLPPFLMAGVRFLLAGAILALWSYWRDGARPTATNWRAASIAGAFLLLGGNGMVVWAEQRVPSGLAALLVATMPLWMVIVAWAKPGGRAPKIGVAAGILLGISGLLLLVGPGSISGQAVDRTGAIVLTLASLSWAIGSLYSRTAPLPKNAILATGLEMIAGGVLLILLGTATGEWSRLDTSHPSTASIVSFFYLVVFGSLLAFTAFAWLIRVSTPTRVSTYAFVNPVVAVFLGWAIAHEPVTKMTVIATAVIVAAVALITLASGSGKSEPAAAGD
jgi:drug/metabolite transporter (DMT)-like permease